MSDSIFRRYFTPQRLEDRFLTDQVDAVDVIIPVLHTNELWAANLFSIYREIPVNRLLIGDGGCIDDSVDIARGLPRVEVFDHRPFTSLGFSIRKLIEAVKTDWFVYLHSDVYLPSGWFDVMARHRPEFDWFGCPMQHTVMVEYELREETRPWAGSQMGRLQAFVPNLHRIEDDYVYRQEDFVLADVVQRSGGAVGKVEDTFHYHQTMYRPSPFMRRVTFVGIETEIVEEEEIRTWSMQLRGIIKYLDPTSAWLINDVRASLEHLDRLGQLDWDEIGGWVRRVNPVWLPYVKRAPRWKRRARATLGRLAHRILD